MMGGWFARRAGYVRADQVGRDADDLDDEDDDYGDDDEQPPVT